MLTVHNTLQYLTHIKASLVGKSVNILGSPHEDEAEGDDEDHGEEDGTVEHIFSETELPNQLE